jgi:hypothetical protein
VISLKIGPCSGSESWNNRVFMKVQKKIILPFFRSPLKAEKDKKPAKIANSERIQGIT